MERRIAGITYILITFAIVNEMSINVQAKDNNKRKPKEKSGGFLANICDISDRDSEVHCYCENTRELKNATKAECWVFNAEIPQDDILWQSFASQPTLQTLSFSVRVEGALSYVPTKAFQFLNNLESINIRYGNISDVTPYSFANLTNLTDVTIIQNQIENLHQHAFAHLPNITLINLEENMIIEIRTDVFYNLPKLKKLIFAKNNISLIQDGAFVHTFNLLELDLNKNNIIHLRRHTFDGLANLKKLDLRRNHLYNLSDYTFAELWNLQELLLGNNGLNYVAERAFDGLSLLQKLCLEENKLISIPPNLFEGVRGLSSLDIRSNKLHALTYDNIKPILDNLKPYNSNLLLEDNNFKCDCRLQWMYSLLNETTSKNTKASLEGVTCIIDSPIVSSAYNKMPDVVENKIDYNKKILHAGITIETLNEKMNATKMKTIPEELKKDLNLVKKPVKRLVLKIAPENLPCPEDTKTTTEGPRFVVDPAIPIRNEMKTFRFYEPNTADRLMYTSIILLWSGCFAIFFT